MKTREELTQLFVSQVDSYFLDEKSANSSLYDETDFHALTCGWAMAHGLNPCEAYDFATYIRYETELG
jgi:hypothetical protein